MNSERLAAEGSSAATVLFAEPHDFSRLTEGMATAAMRVPPKSVRKLGIRALKPMTDERMCLRKCKIYFFLTHMNYRSLSLTQAHSVRLNGHFPRHAVTD
jgi:hypothetical protein